ncbi:class I SAM-dependent methyltransferase [Mediterraneibacter glycyrrhizinilyticus]|uniref:class I SAM-dependent methyltransferase n=1 Tax=Mediterraneibacter glycyrrhizinilyticus TaxID=342942 RepID=UPI0025AA5DDF|nr:SAM-dependent methyltransferase [Mediterraneibacter glycyrrhizinilyticus]MDN0044189.1 SAM-dependent methyltransferase [Mediterraneibacter glycyrrhizinilyticus]
MEEISRLFDTVLNIDFIRAVISNPREKDGIIKVKVRPLRKKDKLVFQFESFTAKQAFHKNLEKEEAREQFLEYAGQFRQMQIETTGEEYTVLISKKGKATVKKKTRKEKAGAADLSHNRRKHYILEEGIPVPFLKDLGVMTEDGKIVRTKTDKFRQINRFLEFIEDILPQLDRDRELTILDFGCGKSYLTFAMYYYLHELKGYDIRIVGLDLKEDVIRHCGNLAEKYGYDKLSFLVGDIADYEGVDQVDMVVTLHACDTATDYALAKAVGWNAKVILSVPCCQHELNAQLSPAGGTAGTAGKRESTRGCPAAEILAPVMDYGLLRERFAALVTDGLRAKYLESMGYETQVLEFIDMEHTPKNILLRAVKKYEAGGRRADAGKKSDRRKAGKAAEDIIKCEQFLQAELTLGRLVNNKGE